MKSYCMRIKEVIRETRKILRLGVANESLANMLEACRKLRPVLGRLPLYDVRTLVRRAENRLLQIRDLPDGDLSVDARIRVSAADIQSAAQQLLGAIEESRAGGKGPVDEVFVLPDEVMPVRGGGIF